MITHRYTRLLNEIGFRIIQQEVNLNATISVSGYLSFLGYLNG